VAASSDVSSTRTRRLVCPQPGVRRDSIVAARQRGRVHQIVNTNVGAIDEDPNLPASPPAGP
jgi:hypothetical protein